jgi:hypothetical protein
VVAAVEGGKRAVAGAEQAVGAGSSEAGEAERAAHHESSVDNSRGEPGFLWRDVAHGGEQQRVERDAGAELVNGGWLVVRLAALLTVVLAVASVDAAASAALGGWRPTGVQVVSLVGSFGATGVLLLVAAYWGLFAFRW